MIWASDTQGRATYLSPEWLTLTGQELAEAEGWGWLKMVHPDDRRIVRAVLGEATSSAADFSVTFRLCRAEGGHLWVIGGAMPSFSPQDGRFLGFLGSLSEAPSQSVAQAESRVGLFNPLPPGMLTRPNSALDLIADHLLMARALAAELGEEMLRSIIDMCLLETGQRLASTQRKKNGVALN